MTVQERRRRQRQRRRRRWALGAFGAALSLTLMAAGWMLWGPEQRCPAGESAASSRSAAAFAATETPETLPEGYLLRQMTEREFSEGSLVLVNRAHSFDPELPDTVSIYEHKSHSYFVKDVYLSVTPETLQALNAWMDAFDAACGVHNVNIVAGWRSRQDQEALYQNAVETKGQAHADAYLALPGQSEHHTGLAVDLDSYNEADGSSGGFDGTGDYAWVVDHAWEYGFVQRYPPEKREITGIDYESWHFRYVGLPHAYQMAKETLCLEEYIDYLRRFPFSGEHLRIDCLGKRYELYYCQGSQIVVPAAGCYTVSSNHVDGYIVTLELP